MGKFPFSILHLFFDDLCFFIFPYFCFYIFPSIAVFYQSDFLNNRLSILIFNFYFLILIFFLCFLVNFDFYNFLYFLFSVALLHLIMKVIVCTLLFSFCFSIGSCTILYLYLFYTNLCVAFLM